MEMGRDDTTLTGQEDRRLGGRAARAQEAGRERTGDGRHGGAGKVGAAGSNGPEEAGARARTATRTTSGDCDDVESGVGTEGRARFGR